MYQGSRQNNDGQFPMGGNGSMNPMRMGGGGGGNLGNFSHKAPTLSTDLQCYFDCPDGFKKDYDLRLHLKLRHKNEDQNELIRAYQAAEEEIALTKRTYSLFQCSLCPKQLNEVGSFYDHVRKAHNMEWIEYRDKYGRCEVESAPFECKICGRVVKYNRDSIDGHLKYVHSINWVLYLQRIRKMRRGEKPEELPTIDFFECKICSVSVKYIWRKDHLKRVHKITEPEYIELYKDDIVKNEVDRNNNSNEEYQENRCGSAMQMLQNLQPIQPPMGNPQLRNPNNAFQGPNYLSNRDNYYEDNENGRYGTSEREQNPQAMHPDNRNVQANYFSRSVPSSDNRTSNSNTNLPKPPKSDIQDIKNKECSSCSIKFETRRMFIEHCTSVHKMKFKTVSGATISASKAASQTVFPPQQTGQKRSLEEEDGMMQSRNPFKNQVLQKEEQTFEGSETNQAFDLQQKKDEDNIEGGYKSSQTTTAPSFGGSIRGLDPESEVNDDDEDDEDEPDPEEP